MTGHINLRVRKFPAFFEHQLNFDLFEPASGSKIGYLAGVVHDSEFRVLILNVRWAERKLSPSEWKSVLDGLRNLLPETVTEITGNRLGEGKKQITLRQPSPPDIDMDR